VYGSKAIPEAAIDVVSKCIPTDFKINWPLPDVNKNKGDSSDDMEVSEGAAAAAAL
jgi:hypothetical protein